MSGAYGPERVRTDPVRAKIFVEARPCAEDVEWTRAEWDAMTPAERQHAIDSATETAIANAGGAGYKFEHEDDEPDVAGVPRNDEANDLPHDEIIELARLLNDRVSGYRAGGARITAAAIMRAGYRKQAPDRRPEPVDRLPGWPDPDARPRY